MQLSWVVAMWFINQLKYSQGKQFKAIFDFQIKLSFFDMALKLKLSELLIYNFHSLKTI